MSDDQFPPTPAPNRPVTIEVSDPTDPEAYVLAVRKAQVAMMISEMWYGMAYVEIDEDGIHVGVDPHDMPEEPTDE